MSSGDDRWAASMQDRLVPGVPVAAPAAIGGQFLLTIDLEGDQFGDSDLLQNAVAAKLHEVSILITEGRTAAIIRDASGNRRGEWQFKV